MNPMNKMQKLVYTGVLITAVFFFIYSLGFSTNMAFASSSIKDFSKSTQTFNHIIFSIALLLLVFVAALRLVDSRKRIIFYKSNIILSYLLAGIFIVVGVFNAIFAALLQIEYQNVKVEYASDLDSLTKWMGTQITDAFYYMGYIASAVLIVMAFLLVIFVKKKIKSQKEMLLEREAMLNVK